MLSGCQQKGYKLMTEDLVQAIGSRGRKLLAENIGSDEKVLVQLQGAFGQVLVVTDKRFYIIKWGFMTGSTFGGQCLAFEYKNISGVKITKNFATGLFEIVTPGNQDTQKSYWGSNNRNNANKADNIVVFRRKSFGPFQQAANLARDLINQAHNKN